MSGIRGTAPMDRARALEGIRQHKVMDSDRLARLELLLRPDNVSPDDMKEAQKLIHAALSNKWRQVNKQSGGHWVESERGMREFLGELTSFAAALHQASAKERKQFEASSPGKKELAGVGLGWGAIAVALLLAPFGL